MVPFLIGVFFLCQAVWIAQRRAEQFLLHTDDLPVRSLTVTTLWTQPGYRNDTEGRYPLNSARSHLGGTITYTKTTITVEFDQPNTLRLTLALLLDEINQTKASIPGDPRPLTCTLKL